MDFSNFEELNDSPLWIAAIGQCFFSLSVCMGVMTAFGSYNPINQDVATDEKLISFLDVGASLMSGFVVYCILGFLANETGDDSWYSNSGPGLVFGAFPVAIAQFKGIWRHCSLYIDFTIYFIHKFMGWNLYGVCIEIRYFQCETV